MKIHLRHKRSVVLMRAGLKLVSCAAVFALALCVVPETGGSGQNNPQREKTVFPGTDWERADPATNGLCLEALAGMDALMKKAEANGVLIHNGYLVAEWTYSAAPDVRINAKSITKRVLGMLYVMALDEGLIPSPDTRVKELWPDFDAGPYADEITFDHLVTATSGLKATGPYWQNFTGRGRGLKFRPPGLPSEYYNDHTVYLAGALTYLYECDLLVFLRDRMLHRIGADADWTTNGEGAPERLGNHGTFRSADSNDPVVPPGYVTLSDGRQVRWVTGCTRSHWTARDLARVGWLYINNGKWNGIEVIPWAYIQEYQHKLAGESPPVWPHVWPQITDHDWWVMTGSGGQFCLLIPEHNMVLAKLNNWRNKSNGGDSKRVQVGVRDFVPLLSNVKKREGI